MSRTNRSYSPLKPTGTVVHHSQHSVRGVALMPIRLNCSASTPKTSQSRWTQGVRNHAISLSQTDEHGKLLFCSVRLHIKMKPDIL